jgi:hypothetical protein
MNVCDRGHSKARFRSALARGSQIQSPRSRGRLPLISLTVTLTVSAVRDTIKGVGCEKTAQISVLPITPKALELVASAQQRKFFHELPFRSRTNVLRASATPQVTTSGHSVGAGSVKTSLTVPSPLISSHFLCRRMPLNPF